MSVLPFSSDNLNDTVQLRKKKTTSVSFSLEDSKEQDNASNTEVQKIDEHSEKQAQETKKNKVNTMALQLLFFCILLM